MPAPPETWQLLADTLGKVDPHRASPLAEVKAASDELEEAGLALENALESVIANLAPVFSTEGGFQKDKASMATLQNAHDLLVAFPRGAMTLQRTELEGRAVRTLKVRGKLLEAQSWADLVAAIDSLPPELQNEGRTEIRNAQAALHAQHEKNIQALWRAMEGDLSQTGGADGLRQARTTVVEFPQPTEYGTRLCDTAALVLALHEELQSKSELSVLMETLGKRIDDLERSLRWINSKTSSGPLTPHVLTMAYVMRKLCVAYAKFDRSNTATIGPLADELDGIEGEEQSL